MQKKERQRMKKKFKLTKKLPKNHVGKDISYTWDKCALEEEALKWNDKTILNWSEVGMRYNILDKSGKVARLPRITCCPERKMFFYLHSMGKTKAKKLSEES